MDDQRRRDNFVGKSVAAMAAALLVAGVVNAQSVLFTLEVNVVEISPGVGAWELFAETSLGDNAGLVSFNVPLVNVDYPVTIETPYLQYTDGGFYEIGMHFFEVNTAPAIGVTQNVPTMPPVFGFGQTAGTLTLPVGATFVAERNPSYDAKLLLASGTYDTSGVPDILTDGLDANVFDDTTSQTPIGAAVTKSVVFIPEPATIALLLLGAVGFVAASRQSRR